MQTKQKMDLRVRQTYSFLTTALFELMLEKPFEEISVIDICNRASVHRTTFYKHFIDKHQLLEVAIHEMRNKFDALCAVSDRSSTSTAKEYYISVFKNMLKYISQTPELFTKGIFRQGNGYVSELFKKTVVEYLASHFSEDNKKENITLPAPVEMMAEYYAGAAIFLACWWLENGMKISIDDMASYLKKLCSGVA